MWKHIRANAQVGHRGTHVEVWPRCRDRRRETRADAPRIGLVFSRARQPTRLVMDWGDIKSDWSRTTETWKDLRLFKPTFFFLPPCRLLAFSDRGLRVRGSI